MLSAAQELYANRLLSDGPAARYLVSRGFSREVLEREQVPKKPSFTPEAVSSWWKAQFSAERGLKHEPDTYLSNLLQIKSTPPNEHL